jgi:hypothetical protein
LLVELSGLVVTGLKNSGTSHGRFRSGDDGEVLAGNA